MNSLPGRIVGLWYIQVVSELAIEPEHTLLAELSAPVRVLTLLIHRILSCLSLSITELLRSPYLACYSICSLYSDSDSSFGYDGYYKVFMQLRSTGDVLRYLSEKLILPVLMPRCLSRSLSELNEGSSLLSYPALPFCPVSLLRWMPRRRSAFLSVLCGLFFFMWL